MMRRLAVLLCGLTLAAATLTATSAPAPASQCTPFPSCFGTAYQVTGTPDNSLTEWTYSPSIDGSPIRSVPNNYTLWISCQANNGPQEDGKYNVNPSVPSTTWDYAWDPGINSYVWVYDWWMNTPPQQAAYGWYSWSDTPHHCNFTPWTDQSARNDLIQRISGPAISAPIFGLRDNIGGEPHVDTMDTAKVISVGASSYLAVFTTGTTVSLATSTDLVNWQWTVDLDHYASQPYIAREADGSFLLADEALDSATSGSSHVHFMHYGSLSSLEAGSYDWLAGPPYSSALGGQRFFSSCNEGTPDIHGISANGLTIDFGFHYNSVCGQGLDREAFGRFTITNINYSAGQASGTWSATEDTVRDDAVSSLCQPGTPQTCYNGKHGGRDDILWHGYRFSLEEAQDIPQTGSELGDFATWRFVLYDYANDQAYRVSLAPGISAQCHGNPKITALTNPSGQPVLLITAFIFGECGDAFGEGGEVLYQVSG